MRSSIITLLATCVYVADRTIAQVTTPNLPQVTAPAKSLGLGAICSSTEQCAGNAQCYGTTAFTIPTCGSFNAECSSDDDCATNTCQNGICSGYLASSLFRITSTATATSTATGPGGSSSSSAESTSTDQGPLPRPSSTIVAAPGSLPVGSECANDEQCAGGAQCYASNFMLITICGNFQASCTNDSQCAYNPCSGGLCSGFFTSSSSLSSSLSSSVTGSVSILPVTSSVTSTTATVVKPSSTGTAASNGTQGYPTVTSAPPIATGGASSRGVGVGIGIVALALALAL